MQQGESDEAVISGRRIERRRRQVTQVSVTGTEPKRLESGEMERHHGDRSTNARRNGYTHVAL